MTHSCNHCKTEFRQRRRNQFYCSQSCRQMAYVERKFAPNADKNTATDKLAGLTSMLGNMEPDRLIDILTAAVNNPSMTDKLTDQEEHTIEPHDTTQNPSQNVNSELENPVQKPDSYNEDPYENYLKTPQTENREQQPGKTQSIFDRMIREGYTIAIGPNGYVRSLFPHWENKNWDLSLYVNKRILQIFDALLKASDDRVISRKKLMNCYEQMKEFGTGVYAPFLPSDYPFMPFIRFLMQRLEAMVENAKGMKETKFGVSDELEKMMVILKIQLQ